MITAKSLALVGMLGLTLATPTATAAPGKLHLIAVHQQERIVGKPHAARVGDEQLGSGILLDAQRRQVGSFGFTCVWTGVHPHYALEQCSGWGKLSGGQLIVAGMSRSDSSRHTWAIVGGTGDYRGAAGDLRLHDVAGGKTILDLTVVSTAG